MTNDFDVAIIGGGPGGLTAAIYAVRRGLSTVVFESTKCGGAMLLTPRIENYPGFEVIAGAELGERMQKQAEAQGAKIEIKNITRIAKKDGLFELFANSGEAYNAKTVIVATGGLPRKIGIPGEEEYLGRGFSHCATCDGPLFKNKTTVVIGGGNSAISTALYLNDICSKVYIAYRRDSFFRAEQAQIDALEKSNVEILLNATPVEIIGEDGFVTKFKYKNTQTGEEKTVDVNGVFAEIGTTPASALVKVLGVDVSPSGHIKTNKKGETNVPGIFAAGDVSGGLPQIATAVGEGAIAATSAYEHIKAQPAGADYRH